MYNCFTFLQRGLYVNLPSVYWLHLPESYKGWEALPESHTQMIKGRSQFKFILSDFRSWAHPLSHVSGLLRVSPYLRVREGTLSSRAMTLKEVSAIVWVPQSRCDFGQIIWISASLSVAVFIYEDSLVAHTPWTIQDVSTFKSQIHDPNPTQNSLFYDHWKARGKWATGTAGTGGL